MEEQLNKIADFEIFFNKRLEISHFGIRAITEDVIKTYIEIDNFSLDNFISIENKSYSVLELIFAKVDKKHKYEIFQELKIKLEILIEEQLNNNNLYKLQLIFRYIEISSQYQKLDFDKLEIYFTNIYINKNISHILSFFKLLFKRTPKKSKLFEFIKDKFLTIEQEYFIEKLAEDYIEPHISLGQYNYLEIGDIFNSIGDNEQSMKYYKALIDQSIKICNSNFQECSNSVIKLELINSMLVISKDKVSSYKSKELKLLFTDANTTNNMLKNMQSISSPEVDKLLKEIFEYLIADIKQLKTDEEVLEYIFLIYFHFQFIDKEIYNNCVEKYKKSFLSNLPEVFFKIKIDREGNHSIMKDKVEDINRHYRDCIYETAVFTLVTLLNIDKEIDFVEKTYLTLINYSKEIDIIKSSHKIFAEKSINYFKNKDYIEFMHLAPPLIEHILRNYLKNIDGDNLSFKDNVNEYSLQFKTLDELIEVIKKSNNNYLDNAMLSYFQTILTKEFNLRNKMSHGLLDQKEFDFYNSMAIFSILGYLITYFKNDEKE